MLRVLKAQRNQGEPRFAPRAERVPNEMEMVLFRVLQESLVNVHRHSGASIVDIALKRNAQTVIMEVHDDGHGIAPELLNRLREANTDVGVGLAGMRERINDLNGCFDIESSSIGTTLRVSLPLACHDLSVQGVDPVEARAQYRKAIVPHRAF